MDLRSGSLICKVSSRSGFPNFNLWNFQFGDFVLFFFFLNNHCIFFLFLVWFLCLMIVIHYYKRKYRSLAHERLFLLCFNFLKFCCLMVILSLDLYLVFINKWLIHWTYKVLNYMLFQALDINKIYRNKTATFGNRCVVWSFLLLLKDIKRLWLVGQMQVVFWVLVVDIMGKPARWLKSVLLGKKQSKSSGSKDKEVTLQLTFEYINLNS